jgi:hypothetical protein
MERTRHYCSECVGVPVEERERERSKRVRQWEKKEERRSLFLWRWG